MARSPTTEERDQRSLARQLQEDDDVIVLEQGHATSRTDTGSGITNCLNEDITPQLGFSNPRIPAATPLKPQVVRTVNFEDVSDPDPSEVDSDSSTTARARTAVEEEEEEPKPNSSRARTDEVSGLTPTRSQSTNQSALDVSTTPSTPEDQRQFDSDDCPATRAEFRKMRKQLRETRLAVNELIQKRNEDS